MLCDVVMCTLNPKLEDHLNLRKHKMLNKISEMLLLLLLLLWAGYSADILCTVTLEARQERRDQGSLSNFLYSRYIIVFRTSKVVSTEPSLFHLHCRYFVVMKPLRRHVRKTTVSCDWRSEAGSRDHNAHL